MNNVSTILTRLTGLAVLALVSASCAKSAVSPTPMPTPVDPPVIACPASISLTSPLGGPISVVYGQASVSGGASPITTSCTPATGSTFPLGTTSVTCTAVDTQQRSSSCKLSVTVTASTRVSLTRFAAFGDSITAGEDGQNALTSYFGGVLSFDQSIILLGFEYPTVLSRLLKGRYTQQADGITVVNNGKPGEPAGDSSALTRFTTAISGQQAVFIMEGSNDLYLAFPSTTSITDAAIANLRTMVQRAKAAGVRPYLATVPPMNPVPCIPTCRGFAAALVPAFNDRIRLIAASEGITLVDVNKAFNGDLSLLSVDGLHPNVSGYDRIASTFFDAVKSTLE